MSAEIETAAPANDFSAPRRAMQNERCTPRLQGSSRAKTEKAAGFRHSLRRGCHIDREHGIDPLERDVATIDGDANIADAPRRHLGNT